MNKEQEVVWDRLKYGMPSFTVHFHGNGIATKFNSGWLTDSRVAKITVEETPQNNPRDFVIQGNSIVFKAPPMAGSTIAVEVYA